MSTTNYVLAGPNVGIDKLVATLRSLEAPITAVVVGDRATAEAVAAAGVDACCWYECPADVTPEAFAAAVAELVAASPGTVVAGRDPVSRVLLGAAAAAVGAPVLNDVISLAETGGAISVTQGVYGGIAQRTVEFAGPVALMIDGGATTAAGEPATITRREAGHAPIAVTGMQAETSTAGDLSAARRVVGVGTGLKSRDDLPIAESFTAALAAELGCTRPLSEGLEWLPRDRYIGISGRHIAPDLYLAVGISGQLQHMAGVRGAGTIVAVNSDASAPIAAEADYFVVGDLYEVLPAIIDELG